MENENEEKSKIEELKKHLDSRSFSQPDENIRRPTGINVNDIRDDWSEEDKKNLVENPTLENQMAKKQRNFLKKFLVGSVAFFILALAIASFVLFGGGNIISSDNVEVSVSGPVSVSGGERLSLDIIVFNDNNTALELADLIVEYPDGTRSPNNLSLELPRERFPLGNIGSGDKFEQEINAVLFGEEGSKEKIKLTVEYRVSGSNAIFFKEKEYEIEISSSPVSFSIESLTEVNSGKEISLDVTLKSNSNNLIEDLMFIAEYPFGFTFKESVPRTSYEQNIWKIGDLSPGEEKKIEITGVLEGQDNEERIFRFFSGLQSEDDEQELKTAFVSSTQLIFIKKPFLSLDIVVDGSTSNNYSTPVGEIVNVDILWKNNLPTSIANVEIEAKIVGDVDENSVFVRGGFFDSLSDIVVWNQERSPFFESVNPGDNGTVNFRFNSMEFTGASLRNPEVSLNVSVRGRRLSESNVSEEVISSSKKSIRFDTNLSLAPRIVHFSGPILNSGPIPPKAEVETTYTVIWTLSNSVNNASDIVISAKLPSYIRWTANTSASEETLNYNSVNREVSWDVGAIASGSGFSSSAREVAFQIGFTPSLSQVNNVPILVNKSKVTAKDDFTGALLESTKGELTTRISTDPSFKTGGERVID